VTDEPHSLFLPEAGEPIVIPTWITITRERPWRESYGKVLRPEEIPDLETIRDRWGAGVYFVQARDQKKQVLASRRFTVRSGGKPRAMDDEGAGGAAEGEYTDNFPPMGGLAPAAAPAARDDNFAMLIAMMREDKESRRLESQAFMAAERERNQAFHSTMLEVLKQQSAVKVATVVQGEGEAKGAKESFMEGMEFMSTLAKEIQASKGGGGGEEDGDEVGKTFRTIATIWAMKNLGPEGAAQVGAMLNGGEVDASGGTGG
jgi:hypothetical protein